MPGRFPLEKKEMSSKQKKVHAGYIFNKSKKITPGWISAMLWINGNSVSRDVIMQNAKEIFKMLGEEK